MLGLVGAFALFADAGMSTRLYVVTPATYGEEVSLHQNVKDECQMERKLPDRVIARLSQRGYELIAIDDISKAGTGKVLTMTVVSARGVGGGSWSGSKSIVVKAELLERGKSLASIRPYSTSRGTIFAMSTCDIFDRTVEQVSKAVDQWLGALLQNAGTTSEAPPPEASGERAPAK
jgi:hypothetical protein